MSEQRQRDIPALAVTVPDLVFVQAHLLFDLLDSRSIDQQLSVTFTRSAR